VIRRLAERREPLRFLGVGPRGDVHLHELPLDLAEADVVVEGEQALCRTGAGPARRAPELLGARRDREA